MIITYVHGLFWHLECFFQKVARVPARPLALRCEMIFLQLFKDVRCVLSELMFGWIDSLEEVSVCSEREVMPQKFLLQISTVIVKNRQACMDLSTAVHVHLLYLETARADVTIGNASGGRKSGRRRRW